MTFVVVGGGPTGVELAGALGEIAHDTLKRDFRAIRPGEAQIVLVEALERILPPYPPDRSRSAQRQLERLGVEVRTGTRVVEITERPFDVVGGRWRGRGAARPDRPVGGRRPRLDVRARPWPRRPARETDRAGRVVVGPDLTIPGHPEIFVVGDAAVQPWKAGPPDAGRRPGRDPGRFVRRGGDPPADPEPPGRAVPLPRPGRRRRHRAAGRGDEHRLAGARSGGRAASLPGPSGSGSTSST